MNNSEGRSSGSDPVAMAIFAIIFVAGILAFGGGATVITFILPESYAGTARILATPDPAPDGAKPAGDETFISTACEIIQSSVVLSPVVEKLNLNETWGKKYFNGETLKTSESLEILKQRIHLTPVRDTWLISITAYSDDKNEAAELANAIADAYRDYRQQSYKGPPPSEMLVQIADPAVPGLAPVKPNKPLNIALGFGFGAIMGAVVGGVVAFFVARVRRRRA